MALIVLPAHAVEYLTRLPTGAPAPAFAAQGADGRQHRLADHAGKVVVLEWTSPACPYSTLKYERGFMQAVQRRAARQEVVWLTVDTAAPGRAGHLTPKAAQARVAKTGATVAAFLLDEDGRVGRAYGARVTPTLIVIGKDGRIAYQGALDDDPRRKSPNGPDHVTDALADLAAGRPVRRSETRAYGCAVEY